MESTDPKINTSGQIGLTNFFPSYTEKDCEMIVSVSCWHLSDLGQFPERAWELKLFSRYTTCIEAVSKSTVYVIQYFFTVFSLQPIFVNWKSYFGGIRKALENDHKLGSMLTVWVTVHFYDGKVIFADQLITHWHHIKRKPNLGIKRFIFLMVSNAFNSLS